MATQTHKAHASKIFMSSRARLGQFLVASAVLTPAAIGAYKWKTDPEFKNTISNLKLRPIQPPTPPMPVIPPVEVKAPSPPPAVAPPPPPPVVKEEPQPQKVVFPKISLLELEDLEKKLTSTAATAAEEEEIPVPVAIVDVTAAPVEPEKKPETPPPAAQQQEVYVVDHRNALEQVRLSSTKLSATVAQETKQEIEQAQQKLKQEIELVLAKDLSELQDPILLKQRIVQLTLELQDRNKWEALRLHEVITNVTHQLSAKFQQLFRQQEQEYENIVRVEVAAATSDAVQKTEQKLRLQLEERLQHQRNELRKEMEALVLRARDEERSLADEERNKRAETLQALIDQTALLSGELAKAETLLQQQQRKMNTLQLASKLQSILLSSGGAGAQDLGQRVEECLGEIRVASHGDKVVCDLVDALPHRVFAAGLCSPSKLARDFDSLELQESIVQQSLNKVSKMLTIGGGAAGPSVLQGVDEENDDDDELEATKEKVSEFLKNDRVFEAVQFVEQHPKFLTKLEQSETGARWLGRARDRLKVEATLRVLVAWLSDNAA